MKLAAIYNVWDGDELLAGSMRQIRRSVDHIIVVHQEVSNFGEEYISKVINYIPYIDQQIFYTPNLAWSGTKNETAKRQLGLDAAIAAGCTHFIFMDCDEYYSSDQFERCKDIIGKLDIETSVIKMQTYYKEPVWQVEGLDNYYVPFICKIVPGIKCGFFPNFPFYCDPTRQINTRHAIHLIEENIVMHHYSWVRKDIVRKLNNSSAKVNFKEKIAYLLDEFKNAKLGSEISWFQNRKLILAPNTFKIESYSNSI